MIKRSSDKLTLYLSRKDGNFRTSIFKNESTCADAVICFFSLNGIWYHRTWLCTQFRFVYFIEWSLAPPQFTLDPMNHRKANPSFTMSRILSYFSTDFPPQNFTFFFEQFQVTREAITVKSVWCIDLAFHFRIKTILIRILYDPLI